MGYYRSGFGVESQYFGDVAQEGGGGGNSFTTIDCPSGTDPVADSASDTLTLLAGAGITITGDSAADSITIASTSAVIPAGTEANQHLEWNGSAWTAVDHLQLGTASTPAAEIRFNGTSNRIYGASSGVLRIDSPRIEFHEGSPGNERARIDSGALLMISTTPIHFNTSSQSIVASSTNVLRYSVPASHDFFVSSVHEARITSDTAVFGLDSGTFQPALYWGTANTLKLIDQLLGAGAGDIVQWGPAYQLMTSTNELRFFDTSQRIWGSDGSTLDIDAATTINFHIATSTVLTITSGKIESPISWTYSSTGAATLQSLGGTSVVDGSTGVNLRYNTATMFIVGSNYVAIGNSAAGVDYQLRFNGETNSCVIEWKEDEDYLLFADDILMNSTERIYFSDLTQSIYASSASTIDIEAQTTANIRFTDTQAGIYFAFTHPASGSDYAARLTFRGYDSDVPEFADIGYIQALKSFSGVNQYFTFFLGATAMVVNPTYIEVGSLGDYFGGSGGMRLNNLSVSSTFQLNEKSANAWQLLTGGSGNPTIEIRPRGNASLVFNSGATTSYTAHTTSACTNFTLGLNTGSSGSCSITNTGGGAFTVNLIASTEWSFTTSALTIGAGNNFVLATSTGTKFGTGITQLLGFYGVTNAIAQPNNTTDLKDALQNLGLIAGSPSGGSSGATDLDLDGGNFVGASITLSGTIKDGNGNTILDLIETGTAVNWITIQNAATAGTPRIDADGETNVGLVIDTKGTGALTLMSGAAKRLEMNGTGLGFFGVTPVARGGTYTVTNRTTDRSYDCDTVVVAELADIVGTMILDLQNYGLFI